MGTLILRCDKTNAFKFNQIYGKIKVANRDEYMRHKKTYSVVDLLEQNQNSKHLLYIKGSSWLARDRKNFDASLMGCFIRGRPLSTL